MFLKIKSYIFPKEIIKYIRILQMANPDVNVTKEDIESDPKIIKKFTQSALEISIKEQSESILIKGCSLSDIEVLTLEQLNDKK